MLYFIPILWIISFFTNGENKKQNQMVNVLLGAVPAIGVLIILGSGALTESNVRGVYPDNFGVVIFTVLSFGVATLTLIIIKFKWFWKKIHA